MYNRTKIILLSLVLFSATGCSINREVDKMLSPPADTKWVNIEVKNPSPYTEPFPLEVRYISYTCMKKRISGFDGSVITEPSYNVIGIPLQKQNGDIWRQKVAMTGGGSCKWTLSAVNLGIEYIDATHLGKDLVPGTAVGATIAFDNDASRNGKFYTVENNILTYSPKYYPFIKRWSEQKKSSMPNKLYLFGKNAFWNVYFNIIGKSDFFIIYNPVVDESKKIEMIFPYEKKDGVTYTFVYPNGERVSSTEINPDFNKLEVIK